MAILQSNVTGMTIGLAVVKALDAKALSEAALLDRTRNR